MLGASLPSAIAVSLSIMFGIGAIVHLAGPGFVRRAYKRWNFPPKFYRIIGLAELSCALFLAIPETRIWGAVVADMATLRVVVTLFNHRQYSWSLMGVVLMVAMIPAALSNAL